MQTVNAEGFYELCLRFLFVYPGVPIFVEHWGYNLQFYPNFALFSTLGGMNLDHDFFQASILSEDQKKRSSPKLEHFFPRIHVKTKKKVFTKNGTLFFSECKWRPTLRCTPESNYWGGCRCRPYSNYWGDISPHPGFGTPVSIHFFTIYFIYEFFRSIFLVIVYR